jgi:SAM-dependent methyltransferase
MRARKTLCLCPENLGASLLVRRFASEIAQAAGALPIADIACGSGRNAFALARLNCQMFCVDKDLSRLQSEAQLSQFTRMKAQQLDLARDPWPFPPRSLGGIINVHFLLPSLFPSFISSLMPGGYLLIESIPGCGGNYRKLPRAGELRNAFAQDFEFVYYKERRVGPAARDAVVVQLIGRRRSIS